jgi:hypothetical protein
MDSILYSDHLANIARFSLEKKFVFEYYNSESFWQ